MHRQLIRAPLLSVTVAPECITAFNELKLSKKLKYIIYKLSDDYKEIVVEEKSDDGDWETFREKLVNAKANHRGKESKGPRYAVYDFEYELQPGEGKRYFTWLNDGVVSFLTNAQEQDHIYRMVPRRCSRLCKSSVE